MTRRAVIAILIVQAFCAAFFVWTLLASILGLPPLSWTLTEFIEIGAVLGLVLGIVLGAVALRRTQAQNERMHEALRLASGAFAEIVEERFDDWALTPAERDVALFVIKGMSTAEIAALRQTSDGTVKAQTAAIYRKAGVSGRPQLLSLFIDELMAGADLTATSLPPAA